MLLKLGLVLLLVGAMVACDGSSAEVATPIPTLTFAPTGVGPTLVPTSTPMLAPTATATLAPTPTATLAVTPTPTSTPTPAPPPTATPLPTEDSTFTGALVLTPTYASVGVRLSYTNDKNDDGTALLEWKRSADSAWLPGTALVKDTRAVITQLKTVEPNPYQFEYRASLVGLEAGVSYDVRVLVMDADRVAGPNPVAGQVSTWIETEAINVVGRTLWVDGGAGSDSNDGQSESAAFKTIQKAADVVIPGDTVIVKDGTYREHVVMSRSGLATNYVHFKAETPLGVIWKGPVGSSRIDRNNRLLATDASFLRIDGFRFDAIDTNSAVTISGDATDVVVENNFVTNANGEHTSNAPGTDVGTGIQSAEGYSIRIGGRLENPGSNNVTNVARITIQGNEIVVTEREVLEHGGIESASSNQGNHVIRRNTVRFAYTSPGDHGEDCIHHAENKSTDAGFNDTDIYDNICINSTDDGLELDAAGVNLRVWGNTIYGQNLGTSLAAVGAGPVYLFRNVYYAPQEAWTTCVGIKTGENSTGFAFIYHNTFHLDCDGSYGWVNSGNDRTAENQVFRNNILKVTGRAMTANLQSSGEWVFDSDYNLFDDVDGGIFAKMDGKQFNSLAMLQAGVTGKWALLEKNSIAGDVLFVDATNNDLAIRDYRLEETSPGIDAGVVIPGINDASSGWPLTGDGPDMGAFERP